MRSPLDLFFKMGDKVSGGDPRRQLDFTYYMMWIFFTAFMVMFVSNTYDLIFNFAPQHIWWALIGLAGSGLNFMTLKGIYEQRQFLDENKPSEEPLEPMKVESVEEMAALFETKSEEDKDVRKKEKTRKGDD